MEQDGDSLSSKSSNRIKTLRENKKLSQQKLANVLNINQQTLSKYERGKITPQIDSLVKVADYFNCSIDYLVGRDDLVFGDGFSLEEMQMIRYFRQLPVNLQQHIKGIILEFLKYGSTQLDYTVVQGANTND